MGTNDVLAWIFDDGLKKDGSFHNIVTEPFNNKQDVSKQLQDMRQESSKIDAFVSSFGNESVMEWIDPVIERNNEDWLEKYQNATSSDYDLYSEEVNTAIEKELYNPGTMDAAKEIIDRLKPPEYVEEEFPKEFNDILERIKGANTFDDLPDLSRSEVEALYGRDARNTYGQLYDTVSGDFASLEERDIGEYIESGNLDLAGSRISELRDRYKEAGISQNILNKLEKDLNLRITEEQEE